MAPQWTRYNSCWELEFKWVTKSNKPTDAEYYARCKICSRDFRIARGGRNDVIDHERSKIHNQIALAGATSQKMDKFLSNVDEENELAAMEATQTYHMIQENQSFSSMQCQTKIVNIVFKIPKFQCASTKSAAIVEGVFLPIVKIHIKQELETAKFPGFLLNSPNFSPN